jgi:hypothetical protein
MTLAVKMSPWRAPFLKRLAAWVAVLALGIHTLVMGFHSPAIGAVAPPSAVAAPCHGADHDHAATGGTEGDPDKDRGHRSTWCPICQSLQTSGYLPQSAAGLDAPLPGPVDRIANAADLPPRRLTVVTLGARGPPISV